MEAALSLALVREAFVSAGEKRFFLARLFYSGLFGVHWKQAMLAFAYFKCLDDLVDETHDVAGALETLAQQRRLLERVYAGDVAGDARGLVGRIAASLFAHDRRHGSPLRTHLEALLATMEFDTRRRGVVLGAAELDEYVITLGGAVLRVLGHFAAPDTELPAAFIAAASRAYLHADALIDVAHDLGFGVVNVPREDIERDGLRLDPSHPDLRRWKTRRTVVVLRLFDDAATEVQRLESRPMRVLARLHLWRKKISLRRHLTREATQAAAVASTSGST